MRSQSSNSRIPLVQQHRFVHPLPAVENKSIHYLCSTAQHFTPSWTGCCPNSQYLENNGWHVAAKVGFQSLECFMWRNELLYEHLDHILYASPLYFPRSTQSRFQTLVKGRWTWSTYLEAFLFGGCAQTGRVLTDATLCLTSRFILVVFEYRL